MSCMHEIQIIKRRNKHTFYLHITNNKTDKKAMTSTLISPSLMFHGEYLVLGSLVWVLTYQQGIIKPTYARTLEMMQTSNGSF